MPSYSISVPVTAQTVLAAIRDTFLNKTTDGSGNLDLTLTRTPTSINTISVFVGNAGYLAYATNLVGTTLTLIVRKTQYDRINTLAGSVTGLPAGVSTDETAGGPSFTTSTASGGNIGTGAQTGVGPHSHTVQADKISNHTHTVTATDLPVAATQAGLNFSIIYN